MRQNLISMRGLKVTPDIPPILAELEKALSKIGDVRLKVSDSSLSGLSVAGRELNLSVVSSKYSPKECTFILWGCAIPLGFTPMDRHPNLDTPTRDCFYFLGVWEVYYSNLLSMGLGEFAWESVCLAAQLDVGHAPTQISNPSTRYIQAQLGRKGLYRGLVDGVMSNEIQSCLATLGIQGLPEKEMFVVLNQESISKLETKQKQQGFLSLPRIPFRVSSYGRVSTVQRNEGVEIVVEGSGRVVIDLSL